jgi:hypothetical protein
VQAEKESLVSQLRAKTEENERLSLACSTSTSKVDELKGTLMILEKKTEATNISNQHLMA